jgi:GDPmannose 4,6-dehydratase
MFGTPNEYPQTETTVLRPRSPYAVGKAAAHWLVTNYREIHGLYAVSGILFNHESPLRARPFVTRRISFGLAEVKRGKRDVLTLGNLDARRDWGWAGEYVEGMWAMLQQDEPGDYVLPPGKCTRCANLRKSPAASSALSSDGAAPGRRKSGSTVKAAGQW